MINLSYVIATKNKLKYLREVLSQLIKARLPDEEIIVVDGQSIDGTLTYLKKLFKKGKIQQFISEKDLGESHATNKGFLMAHGQLIKLITDDDVFYYPNIKKMKEYMLKYPEIDIIGSDGTATYMDGRLGEVSSYWKDFNIWKRKQIAFSFCGLGMMVRKQSIALIGLFNTKNVRTDMEFTLRATSKTINIAWYTGPTFIRLMNPNSNSYKKYLDVNLEGIELERKYLHQVNFYKIPMVYLKSFALKLFGPNITNKFNLNIEKSFRLAEQKLELLNQKSKSTFVYNKI